MYNGKQLALLKNSKLRANKEYIDPNSFILHSDIELTQERCSII